MRKKGKNPEKDKLTKRILVRLSKNQYDEIETLSKISNQKLSTMIRMLCINKKVNLHSVTDIQTKNELNKIGVNLNQVVRVIHRMKLEHEMKEQLDSINSVILEIRKTIQNLES